MACILPPSGLPTLTKDAAPSGLKTYNASLAILLPRIVNGYADHFDVEWQIDSGITDQTVCLVYREEGDTSFTESRIVADQLDGVVTSETGFPSATVFNFWIRRETPSEVGPWYTGIAVCTIGWETEVNIVYRNTVEVQYLGETVYYFDA